MKTKLSILIFFAISIIACNSNSQTNTSAGTEIKGGNLAALDFAQKIKNTPDAQIVDVRTPSEYKAGHIATASNLDISSKEFEAQAATLDKNKPVFVYCLSGSRSQAAVNYFASKGFAEVYQLPRGMMEWRNNNLPEEKLLITSEGMSVQEYEAMLTSDQTILVDFYAEWCAPCKKMKPYLDRISQENADQVTVIRIDVDQNSKLSKALGIEALPVVKIYKDQKESWSHTGFVEEAKLLELLEI